MSHNVVAVQIKNPYVIYDFSMLLIELFDCICCNRDSGDTIAATADADRPHSRWAQGKELSQQPLFFEFLKTIQLGKNSGGTVNVTDMVQTSRYSWIIHEWEKDAKIMDKRLCCRYNAVH